MTRPADEWRLPAASVIGIYTVTDFTWDSGKRYVGIVSATGRSAEDALAELRSAAQTRADEHLQLLRRSLANRGVPLGAVHGRYAVLGTKLAAAGNGWMAYGTLAHQHW